MGGQSRLSVAVAALAAAFAISACGEDDFENNPRPPAPIELTALINDSKVKVSPSRADAVGAGLATFTISNQSADPAALVLEGPTDEASDEIPPGGTGSMKVALEQGDYVVSAGDDSNPRESGLEVGPERASSQNELLLP
jgi:hypothetical protein